MPNLNGARKRYARKIRRIARLQNPRLIRALAEVPREHFLGPPPWSLWTMKGYRKKTRPQLLYDNVLVGIIPERWLNNGQPSGLAGWFDALDLKRNDCVVHIGCGTGYYTAILAHTVGRRGHVKAIEIDGALAQRAKQNLEGFAQVEVIHGDGAAIDIGQAEAVFVNAGVNFPIAPWLEALNPGGRIVFPLITMQLISVRRFNHNRAGGRPTQAWSGRSIGVMLLARRESSGFSVKAISAVGIFPCINLITRDGDTLASEALARGDYQSIRSIRRDPHSQSDSCWLHHDGACLSRDAVAQN